MTPRPAPWRTRRLSRRGDGPAGGAAVADVAGQLLGALGDLSRFRIVRLLQAGPMSVGPIARALGLPFENVSYHLRWMARAGLVTQSPTSGLYDLGPSMRRLGAEALRRMDEVSLASEYLPGLRDRRSAIAALAGKFLAEFAARNRPDVRGMAPPVLRALEGHDWPGNIRELRNVIERAIILSEGATLRIERPQSRTKAAAVSLMMEDVERSHILRILEQTGWRVRGNEGAASLLGLPPSTLEARMSKLGIRRPS